MRTNKNYSQLKDEVQQLKNCDFDSCWRTSKKEEMKIKQKTVDWEGKKMWQTDLDLYKLLKKATMLQMEEWRNK